MAGVLRFVTPLVRLAVRYVPFRALRALLWTRIVARHLDAVPHRFRARTVFGATIEGTTADVIQRHIYWFGAWEPILTRWIALRLRPGDAFVDVGANIGYFTLLASKLVGPAGAVVAVEASPRIVTALQANVAANTADNVRVVQAIAGREHGRGTLFSGSEENVGRATAVPGTGGDAEGDIDVVPLAELLEPSLVERLRLVKIDVQGYEAEAIAGLAPLLERFPRSCELVIEVHPQLLAVLGQRIEDVTDPLEAAGFHAYRVDVDYTPYAHLRALPAHPRATRLTGAIDDECDLVFARVDAELLD